jgi:hypothetical protein
MSVIKGVISKASAPLVTDDNTKGFFIGFKWTDTSTNIVYEAISVATGVAVWEKTNQKIGITVSGTDTYTATVVPTLTAYVTNQTFPLKFTNANTGASTLNLNGLGAKAIQRNGSLALNGGDILANQTFWVMYDGVQFQLMGRVSTDWQPPAVPLGALLSSGASFFINGGAGVYLSFDGASDDTVYFNDNLIGANGVSYDGSDMAINLHCRLSSNAVAGNTVGLVVSYAVLQDGDNSSTTVTAIAQQNVVVTGRLQDIDFSIMLGTMIGVVGGDTLMFTLTRNSTGAGSDTYSGDLEVISFELLKV